MTKLERMQILTKDMILRKNAFLIHSKNFRCLREDEIFINWVIDCVCDEMHTTNPFIAEFDNEVNIFLDNHTERR